MNVNLHLIPVIEIYAAAAGVATATVAKRAGGDARIYRRLQAGHDITTRRAARITQWLSDHWPAGADWPADIPRPAPAPDSPAAVAEVKARAADPLTALDADGRIADPAGFCRRLLAARQDLDYVLRQYAVGRPRAAQRPRRGKARRIWGALYSAGDVRITNAKWAVESRRIAAEMAALTERPAA